VSDSTTEDLISDSLAFNKKMNKHFKSLPKIRDQNQAPDMDSVKSKLHERNESRYSAENNGASEWDLDRPWHQRNSVDSVSHFRPWH